MNKMQKKMAQLEMLASAIIQKKVSANYDKIPLNVREENEKRFIQYSKEKDELKKCIDEISKL